MINWKLYHEKMRRDNEIALVRVQRDSYIS